MFGGGSGATKKTGLKGGIPTLEEFIERADFVGAQTLLNFQLRSGGLEGGEGGSSSSSGISGKTEGGGGQTLSTARTLAWLGWVSFHQRDYAKALEAYRGMEGLEVGTLEGLAGASGGGVKSLKAACLYHMGDYEGAVAEASSAPDSPLKTRTLFQAYKRLGNEGGAGGVAGKLSKDVKEDALTLAALAFLEGKYTDASEMYKRILAQHRDDVALNLYIALCCFKLDMYEVSLEALGVYLQTYPTSPAAINLKACNFFKLYNGKSAVTELKTLEESGYSLSSNDTLRHNLVVFRDGEEAMRVFPPLMSVPSLAKEARLNLAQHHFLAGRLPDASALVEDLMPATVPEMMIKANVAVSLGQQCLLGKLTGLPSTTLAAASASLKGLNPREAIKIAKALFESVGNSPSEKDTIPGRQAMSLAYFLRWQFDDCLVYLNSIRPYVSEQSDFNWNLGIALASLGRYREGLEALLSVRSPTLVGDAMYTVWLARCYVMVRTPRAAWELYLKRSEVGVGGGAGLAVFTLLLRTIASDCYATGAFFYAALAYDALGKIEPGEGEVWSGMMGACAGVLASVAGGREAKECLREVHSLLLVTLANSRGVQQRQAQQLTQAMQRWAQSQRGGEK